MPHRSISLARSRSSLATLASPTRRQSSSRLSLLHSASNKSATNFRNTSSRPARAASTNLGSPTLSTSIRASTSMASVIALVLRREVLLAENVQNAPIILDHVAHLTGALAERRHHYADEAIVAAHLLNLIAHSEIHDS